MTATPALKFKITQAGLAAILKSANNGFAASFSQLAVGSGQTGTPNGTGYTPQGTEAALKNEFMRVPLGAGQKVNDLELLFGARLDGNATGWINEIGLFLDDGTLWALWSEDPTVIQRNDPVTGAPVYGAPLGYKSANIPYVIGAMILVDAIPLDALNIVVNAPSITIEFLDAAGVFARLIAADANAASEISLLRMEVYALQTRLDRMARTMGRVTANLGMIGE